MATGQNAGEAEVIAKLVAEHMKPAVVRLEHPDEDSSLAATVLITSCAGGTTVSSIKKLLDEYRTEPERRTGTAKLTTVESFIAHVKRFADNASVVFASAEPLALVAVLDYHERGSAGRPRFGTHRSVYEFPISDEWTAWQGSDGKAMPQGDFARFIEDRLADVADPAKVGPRGKEFLDLFRVQLASASKLLELSRGLTVHVGEKTTNAINPATGETTMHFVAEHTEKSGEAVKVPGAFLIGIPVFRGGELYQLPVRLRYRVQSGQVLWFYNLHRVEAVWDAAIDDACDQVAKATGLPLLHGLPEECVRLAAKMAMPPELESACYAEADRQVRVFSALIARYPEYRRDVAYAFLGGAIAQADLVGADAETLLRELREHFERPGVIAPPASSMS